MNFSMLALICGLLLGVTNFAYAAATAETAAAVKAIDAEMSANKKADAAKTDAETAEELEAKAAATAADAAAKAARAAATAERAAKAAATAQIAKAKAAAEFAKKEAEDAKKAAVIAKRRGASSCSEWQQDRAGKATNDTETAWLIGYMAGIAVAKNHDILKDENYQSLFSWVDDYCQSHPLEFVSDAGINLYIEIARQKRLLE